MSSKERDRFAAERPTSPDVYTSKMKAVPMCSTSEEDEKAGGASSKEQGAGDKVQQGTLNRRLSAESQEFEFNKLGGLTSTHMNIDQLHEGGGLASADELFYKGQLLPLQYHTRPAPFITKSLTNSPLIPCHDTIEIPSSKLSLCRDPDVKFSSCRMDHVGMDPSLFEFTRSSSFRSHSSYYCNYYANYTSTCTAFHWDSSSSTSCAGESSSSSRDSNGSSQDSCSSSDNNREQHACSCHGHASSAGVNRPFPTFPKRKPGFMQSWRILFNGFRRGSQGTWGDHQAPNQPSFHGSLSRGAANPHATANQGHTQAACGCKLSNEKSGLNHERQVRSPASKTSLLWADDKEKGSNKKEGENRRGSYALRGLRWQGYTRRIKPISIIKATLAGGLASYDQNNTAAGSHNTREQQGQPARDQGWLPKGRVTRPLERRPSQPSLLSVSGVKGLSKVTFRFQAISSSCPASVRSSPNHSGLLVASPAFNNNMSTMQELHSAVQGAIAHCKQSISSPSSI